MCPQDPRLSYITDIKHFVGNLVLVIQYCSLVDFPHFQVTLLVIGLSVFVLQCLSSGLIISDTGG